MATAKFVTLNRGEYYEMQEKMSNHPIGKAYKRQGPDLPYLEHSLDGCWIVSEQEYKKLKADSKELEKLKQKS